VVDLAEAGGFRPHGIYDDPERLSDALMRRVLPLVSHPARYVGGELGAACPAWRRERANILLAFPDAYEIGMSHTGLRILYHRLNAHPETFADLAFAPWPDMEQRQRELGLPLFGLQTRRSAGQFDLLGFSLGYELSFTNMLTMLDLAGLPLRAAERGLADPVVVAGGTCVLNPAVVAPFVDLVFLGDGEETVTDLADAVLAARRSGESRAELCNRLAGIPGAWRPGAGPVRARLLPDLNACPPPDELVPLIEPVHDRLSLEVMRGCARGCRFCQAGMIHRPVRERDVAPLVEAAERGIRRTGWDEISLLSLSTSDYSGLTEAVLGIRKRLAGRRTNLVLPSLRVDSLDARLYEFLSQEAPGSYTFAPEAGSQRLRDVINKQVTEEDVLRSARRAFGAGARNLKLYFMIGLPTETDADLDAIADLVGRVVDAAPRGGGQVTVSLSPFAPKPHTPFQWCGQVPAGEIARRNRRVESRLRGLRVKVGLRDPAVSALEALLGVGDGRVAEVVQRAWALGARFDGWTECFDHSHWQRAAAAAGVDPAAYLAPRDPAAPLPWDGLLAAVDRDFLRADWERAQRGETLSDCRLGGECYACSACAAPPEHRSARAQEAPAAEDAADQDVAPAAARLTFDPRNAVRGEASRERDCWQAWRRQAAEKCWYRAEYARDGDLRFLGHLDFQRQLQLALRRSGLPLAYSRGYHPHPLLRFGPPLPVGVAGAHEFCDIAFTGQVAGWERTLNDCLPAGLRILRSVVSGTSVPRSIDQAVQRLDYRVMLPPAGEGGPALPLVRERVAAFLESARWPALRRRPKGDIEVDARPLVLPGGLAVREQDSAVDRTAAGVELVVQLAHDGEKPGLPVLEFLAALLGEALPEPRLSVIERTGCHGRGPGGNWRTPFEEVGESNRSFWLRKRLSA